MTNEWQELDLYNLPSDLLKPGVWECETYHEKYARYILLTAKPLDWLFYVGFGYKQRIRRKAIDEIRGKE